MSAGKLVGRTGRTRAARGESSRFGTRMGCPSPSISVWFSLYPQEQRDLCRAVSMDPTLQSVWLSVGLSSGAEMKGTR